MTETAGHIVIAYIKCVDLPVPYTSLRNWSNLACTSWSWCVVSSPGQRPCELLSSFGIHRLLTCHIWICLFWLAGWFMMFNTTFKSISVISCLSALLMEETRVPRENHWPVASHWQTLSHNVVWSTPRHERAEGRLNFINKPCGRIW